MFNSLYRITVITRQKRRERGYRSNWGWKSIYLYLYLYVTGLTNKLRQQNRQLAFCPIHQIKAVILRLFLWMHSKSYRYIRNIRKSEPKVSSGRCRNLFESHRDHLLAVIDTKAWTTKYEGYHLLSVLFSFAVSNQTMFCFFLIEVKHFSLVKMVFLSPLWVPLKLLEFPSM